VRDGGTETSAPPMPSFLTLLVDILVGADTGLQLRRTVAPLIGTSAAAYLPTLSITAALLAGIGLAEAALLVLMERWPDLASYIAGPVLAVYGFVWFQGGVVEHRLRPDRALR